MAIDLLCDIIAHGGKATATAYRERSGYTALIRCGLLQESGTVQSVGCVECDTPHDAEIVHHGGDYGYWCPDLGFVRVERWSLAGVAPDWTLLIAKLADAFACKRRKSTPVHGTSWRIGAIETPMGDLTIYLHTRLLTGEDVRQAEAALRSQVRSAHTIILTAVGSLPMRGATIVPLYDVVDLDPATGALIAISKLHDAVGIAPEPKGGAPNLFGDRVKAIIASRQQSGDALRGKNAEAKAILEAFHRAHPGDTAPSLPTVKRYLSDARDGP